MSKEDKQGIVIIIVLIVLIGIVVALIVDTVKEQEKSYEYALKQEIGVSDKCYLKDDIGYCEVDNKVIRVDNYYEVE